METKTIKFMSMAIVAAMTVFTSCDENRIDPDAGKDETPGVLENKGTLQGSMTSDLTLAAGNTYHLNGEFIVKSGSTLNIEEGVTIIAEYDDRVDFILIEQGGKINAQGTAAAPIVMTSSKEEPGAWGGIHICGNARINAEGGRGSSEIGGASYGGDNDADDSGVLKYVRVEYTGYAFDEEHEANGISFYGVGSGTVVENCEAYMGSDDGFEFFGGSVNIKNMVVVNCSDDSFDWTEGWNGRGENLVAYQESESTLGYSCDCLIEADNNENNYSATPVSHPVLKNLVLVGNGGSKQGVRLRRGTQVEIENAKICGKGAALAVESAETENALKDGTSRLSNVSISSSLSSKEGIYTEEMFVAGGNSSNQDITYASLAAVASECAWMNGWTR